MNTSRTTRRLGLLLLAVVCAASSLLGQLSPSARRVLGQSDLRQNGFNSLEGVELFSPSAVALDERDEEVHVYVVDRLNNRVLGWRDLAALESGIAADLVLGQFDLTRSARFGIGFRGFSEPGSIVVNPENGDVYVSDDGAHRVTRFRNPFAEGADLEPDNVFGQVNFGGTAANTGGVGPGTFFDPSGLAFDADGNLWVADRNNHRIVRYAAAALDEDQAVADLVIGQFDLGSRGVNAGSNSISSSGFRNPTDVAFDANGSLYVADSLNSRILVFDGPQVTGQAANRVIGQDSFSIGTASGGAQPWSLRRINGLAISETGALYASMPEDHRVLIFDDATTLFGRDEAAGVIGQLDTDESVANTGTAPEASEIGLSAPSGLAVAADGTVVIADTGNHRVTLYGGEESAALIVLGQEDFTGISPNQVGSVGMGPVNGVVIDYSTEGFPVYVSDTLNNRVLAWKSTLRFENGAPADRVLGQLGFEASLANNGASGPSRSTLNGPRGLAVTGSGDLLVADSGNNRVLRFRRPFDQNGLAGADLVLGQSVFFTQTSAFINAASMNTPGDVEIGPDGRIYVSDTGNHRVMEFSSEPTNGTGAVRVFGQADFLSGSPGAEVSSQTLDTPLGIAVDSVGFLYVADSGNHRILIFPLGEGVPSAGSLASTVVGQTDFENGTAAGGAARLREPSDVAIGLNDAFFVADTANHRILEYRGGLFFPSAGGAAIRVLGQTSLNRATPNHNSPDGRATAEGLLRPVTVLADRNGMIYVGDSGNNRVVEYLRPAVAVSAATFEAGAGVAAGSISSIFGIGLTADTAAAATVPLPNSLGGSTVEIGDDGRNVPLVFASPGQLNVQIPPSTPIGVQNLWVRNTETDELIGGGRVGVTATRPGLFTFSQDGTGLAVAVNEDGSINSPENPASLGSVVILFGTGQGPTSPIVADGEAPPSGVLANTVAQPTSQALECAQSGFMCVLVGNKVAETLFSGLAPGFVGLWQINVRMPTDEDFLAGPAVRVKVLIDQITTKDDVFISVL